MVGMKSVGYVATPGSSIIQPVSLCITPASSHYKPPHRHIHLEDPQQFEPMITCKWKLFNYIMEAIITACLHHIADDWSSVFLISNWRNRWMIYCRYRCWECSIVLWDQLLFICIIIYVGLCRSCLESS